MNSDFTLTFGTIFVGVLLLAALYILGVGVLPLLKALTKTAEIQRAKVASAIEGIDSRLASQDGTAQRIVHSVASEMHFLPEQAAIAQFTDILNNGLKMGYKIMRETPDQLTEEEVADAANKVAGFIARLTDAIPKNALPDIETDK